MKILIVEDNMISMSIVETIVEDMVDAEILTAKDGREALELFKQSEVGEIRMIITDLIMPDMSGVEATRAIRALGRADSVSVPIIALSAYHADANVELAREAGVNDFLSKPLDREQLREVLKNYLQ